MKEFSFCISMSTIPSRIKNISEVIKNINNQTITPQKIYLNIPYKYKRFPDQKIDDKDLVDLQEQNLEIIRCEDYGPGTKIMGSIQKVRNYDFVILIDDDHLYDKNMCEFFLEAFKKEQINYSFYLNKIFRIKMGQCSDGFLMNTKLLDKIELFYYKFVKYNRNMFLDDDLWLAIYLQKEKKSSIRNLMNDFNDKFNKNLIYEQNSNSKKDSLHLTVHKDGLILNRRKIHKIEYIKYIFKSIFVKI